MSRLADDAFPAVDQVFDAALYDDEAIIFIQEHLGETPNVAQTAPDFPQESAREILEALQRFCDLEELVTMGRLKAWAGNDAVRERIAAWREHRQRYLEHKRADPQGKGFHPEMHSFDSRGKAHWQGPGTDAGRVRWPLELVSVARRTWTDFASDLKDREIKPGYAEPKPKAATFTREQCMGENYVQCPVDGCNERFTFNPESQQSQNSGWARLGKHMRSVKDNVDDHRLAHQEVFPG